MLRLKKVAVTGGLSCGKSSVCRILEELGAYVVSADKIVHHLLSSDTDLDREIVRLLGPEVVVNQKLDRSRIAAKVFQDPNLLKALEALIHPRVYQKLDEEYHAQQHLEIPPSLFVAEIPLLFESGGRRDYESVIAVIADPTICCHRFEQTTGATSIEFKQRMAHHLPASEKARLADHVIENNGSLAELEKKTEALFQKLQEE